MNDNLINSEVPSYFPITLRIDGTRIVIIGGGKIAARKIRLLLRKNVQIEVYAQTFNKELQTYEKEKLIKFCSPLLNENDFIQNAKDATLIFITTDDHDYNTHISLWAKKLNIPVCTVDNAELSTFITPSIIDRDPVQIAISTGGSAPVLGRRIRQKIEPLLGQVIGPLASFIGKHRNWAKEILSTHQERQRLWERFIDGYGTSLISQQKEKQAFDFLKNIAKESFLKKGEVWLVGAGPGDPDLLTIKALHHLQNADIILYDNLLSPKILDYIRRDALLFFVGKQKNHHTLKQEEINDSLIKYARQGKRVLRLKGGDPFIFGRGGEEAEALMHAGIPFKIIPGISASNGCAAYAGIPLTHRECAQACLFLTGHTKKTDQLNLPWENMIFKDQTLVIYMGLSSLPLLCKTLIDKGLEQTWPAAAIEKGTFHDQQVIIGNLKTLPDLVMQKKIGSPVLIIIGQVIHHRVT